MKTFLVIAVFVLGVLALAQDRKILWVSTQYDKDRDRVLFIEDVETHTRCYAFTNSQINMSGYAISCVAAGGR